jgi:hypothetical protein
MCMYSQRCSNRSVRRSGEHLLAFLVEDNASEMFGFESSNESYFQAVLFSNDSYLLLELLHDSVLLLLEQK